MRSVQFALKPDVLKWVATSTLILGTLINALGYYPLGPLVLLIGAWLWFMVAVMWREPALIATNLIMAVVGALGLLWQHFS